MANKTEGRVSKFYRENTERFGTKRQASKYLNQMGYIWKQEQGIPLTDPKRKIS